MRQPVTETGTPGTLADLKALASRPVKPYSDLWFKKVNVWLFKIRKQTDVQ